MNDNNYYKGDAALIDRIEHAMRGLWYAWKKEHNLKIEFFAAFTILFGMFVLPLGALERAVLVLIIAVVLGLEILNSVFERILDLIHPHFSPEVRRIKDTMAGAVLLAVFASLAIGGFILIPALVAFDPVIFRWIENFQAPPLVTFSRLFTLLGNWQIILGGVLIFTPWLLWRKQYEILSLLLGSVIGGEIIVFVLKMLFARERPVFLGDVDLTSPFSFPSGHALIGSAFWLTVGYILTYYSTRRKYLWCVAGVIVVGIAASRLILSVHWFSDIVGGLLLGTFWFFLWFGINQHLFKRGKSSEE